MMKKTAYVKNQIRTISKTRARFLSIFCIVFLGTAFFAGLRHSPIIMKESMHQYLQDYQWNDLDYIGTLGFDQKLIDEVSKVEGIKSIDYGFRFDGLMSYHDQSNIGVIVYSDDNFQKGVDIPELKSGRLPQKDDECLVDDRYFQTNQLTLNQTVDIESDYGKKTYRIVGSANDSRYTCNFDRGTNSLGNGNNSAFILVLTKGNEHLAVPEELFELHDHQTIYNDLRIHLENPDDLYEFDDDYEAYIKPIHQKIKKIFHTYYASFYQEKKDDANQKINDGQKEYDDGLKTYQDGMTSYQNGLDQYTKAKKEYDDGYQQYQQGLKQYQSGLAQYQSGLQQYQEGYRQYQSGLQQYEQSKQQIEQGLQIFGGYEQACLTKAYLESIGQFDEQYQNLVALIEGYDALPMTKQKLNDSLVKLTQSKTVLDQTQQKLNTSKKTLEKTFVKLSSAKKQLDSVKKQLDETLPTLIEAKDQLNQAKIDLDKAKDQVNDLVKGKAIALTKNESVSILSFEGNCASIAGLSILFPVLFFLVAALVSMTTMTRMVEELRLQNGTFRALGYKKKEVILQYLIYAFLATFFASCLGIVFGTYFFPSVIYYLYRTMMFDVGAATKVIFDVTICLQTFVISVAIIMLVTYFVCRKELKEVPASLLRPKAPKLGKRILLEKMTFIWKKLSFNQKVTMRNIFRYKKRFFMSIIGIAGCTALIVVGFGIKGSISPIANEQYGKMWKYDGIINYQNNLDDKDGQKMSRLFLQQAGVKKTMAIYDKTIQVGGQNASIEIPSDKNDFSKFIHLINYQDGKKLTLDNQGVYINAKLSEILDVKTGDTLTIELNQEKYQVKIAGIYKLYFKHYIYMTEDYYKQLTGQEPEYNSQYFILTKDADKDQLTRFANQHTQISSITYTADISESFVKQMESLNIIVIILIVCAGALAFIVLYNLTNINIQERKSEIATIKVLGFYPKEVYDYVFRENIMLSFIGSILGLGLGKYIHAYLIKTVEVDMAMFIRNVHWSSYLFAMILTMAFTFFIDLFMRKVLKKIDMVESLKSIE